MGNLEEEGVLAPRVGTIDVEMQTAGLPFQGLEIGHVEDRGSAREILGVRRGKCLCVPGIELERGGLVEARQQRVLETVGP